MAAIVNDLPDHISGDDGVVFVKPVRCTPKKMKRLHAHEEMELQEFDVAISAHEASTLELDDLEELFSDAIIRVAVLVEPLNLRSQMRSISDTPLLLSFDALSYADLLRIHKWQLDGPLDISLRGDIAEELGLPGDAEARALAAVLVERVLRAGSAGYTPDASVDDDSRVMLGLMLGEDLISNVPHVLTPKC